MTFISDRWQPVVDANPDLVLVATYTPELATPLIEQGLPVYQFSDFSSVDALLSNFETLGQLVGEGDRAEEILNMRRAELRAATNKTWSRPIQVVYYSEGYLVTAGTVPSELIGRAGLVDAAAASIQEGTGYDGPIVVAVRFMGGNDGLNTVIPVNDDRYYRGRPTIAIPKNDTILMPGGDLGLNPWLSEFHRLMDDGHAAIVQGVGYADSSRSHSRGTEIIETGSVDEAAPEQGWLGRYIDHQCECDPEPLAGVQFAEELGRTLATQSRRSKSIANPRLLLNMNADSFVETTTGSRVGSLDYLRQVENELGEVSAQLRQATEGSGGMFAYPETDFGQSLRWTADMIETGSPTRVYYLTIGSFATLTSPSFDTHSKELETHKVLFSELCNGLRAFTDHLTRTGQFDRVLLLSFSEFGRQVEENRDHGTDHGDASLMFLAGGKVRPGLLGEPADLGRVHDGGLEPSVDFRQIYANVLSDWLKVDHQAILGEGIEPFRVVA